MTSNYVDTGSSREEIIKPVMMFRDLNPDDDDGIAEIESLCLSCYEQGKTRLMLTKIPFFREVIISSFQCDHCNYYDRSIQSGGKIQERGVEFTLTVTTKQDLNRQIVKSDYATFSIPELEFEQQSMRKGEISTIEGMIDSVITCLQLMQKQRTNYYCICFHDARVSLQEVDPLKAEKVEAFIVKLQKIKEVEEPFTVIINDPTGNSFVENPKAPVKDDLLVEMHYTRTHQQDVDVGCCAEDEDEDEDAVDEPEKVDAADQPEPKDPNWNFKEEVMSFKINCPNCNTPSDTNMKMIDIPYFKQVVIMATVCDACGHRDNEVKGGTGIEPKGKKITLLVSKREDLNRDVLKSDTAGISIPEFEFEMAEGSLGGRFTTVEGLLTQIRDQLADKNPFICGDSAQDNTRSKVNVFCNRLDKVIQGETTNIHLVLDDPAGNSYLQNLCASDEDPQITIEVYERSFEQNEILGLNDMVTENYLKEEH